MHRVEGEARESDALKGPLRLESGRLRRARGPASHRLPMLAVAARVVLAAGEPFLRGRGSPRFHLGNYPGAGRLWHAKHPQAGADRIRYLRRREELPG